MQEALDRLLSLLDLEVLELNLFRGKSTEFGRGRVFGGQVLAQALTAAYRTVEQRDAHSLHGYFLRPGNPEVPILYEVDRIRDGRSFTTRRVVAIQRGEAIFNMSVSFQAEEAGLEHQIEAPTDAGGPDGMEYEESLSTGLEQLGIDPESAGQALELPVEIRATDGFHLFDAETRPPFAHTWLRARGKLPDAPQFHQCLLAYASDFTVMLPAAHPHPVAVVSRNIQTASLDHAMWFHRRFRADEWILHTQDSPISAQSRGLGRGLFYTEAGTLVASCVQEGLIRQVRPPAKRVV